MILKNKMFRKKINYLDPLLVEKNERIFYINNIKRGDIIFDVGANIGELTLLFSRFTGAKGHVHAFEPTPETFEKLQMMIRISNRGNVTLNKMAVAEHTGTAIFNMYDADHSSWNTFAKRPLENYGINLAPTVPLEVPTITIDDYCIQQSIDRIDLLKIDVEGAELNVLRGATKMFEGKRIMHCVFEFGQTTFDMCNSVEELKQFFSQYNYSIKNVSEIQNVFPIDTASNSAFFSVLSSKPF